VKKLNLLIFLLLLYHHLLFFNLHYCRHIHIKVLEYNQQSPTCDCFWYWIFTTTTSLAYGPYPTASGLTPCSYSTSTYNFSDTSSWTCTSPYSRNYHPVLWPSHTPNHPHDPQFYQAAQALCKLIITFMCTQTMPLLISTLTSAIMLMRVITVKIVLKQNTIKNIKLK
jgi:hypothetical protein